MGDRKAFKRASNWWPVISCSVIESEATVGAIVGSVIGCRARVPTCGPSLALRPSSTCLVCAHASVKPPGIGAVPQILSWGSSLPTTLLVSQSTSSPEIPHIATATITAPSSMFKRPFRSPTIDSTRQSSNPVLPRSDSDANSIASVQSSSSPTPMKKSFLPRVGNVARRSTTLLSNPRRPSVDSDTNSIASAKSSSLPKKSVLSRMGSVMRKPTSTSPDDPRPATPDSDANSVASVQSVSPSLSAKKSILSRVGTAIRQAPSIARPSKRSRSDPDTDVTVSPEPVDTTKLAPPEDTAMLSPIQESPAVQTLPLASEPAALQSSPHAVTEDLPGEEPAQSATSGAAVVIPETFSTSTPSDSAILQSEAPQPQDVLPQEDIELAQPTVEEHRIKLAEMSILDALLYNPFVTDTSTSQLPLPHSMDNSQQLNSESNECGEENSQADSLSRSIQVQPNEDSEHSGRHRHEDSGYAGSLDVQSVQHCSPEELPALAPSSTVQPTTPPTPELGRQASPPNSTRLTVGELPPVVMPTYPQASAQVSKVCTVPSVPGIIVQGPGLNLSIGQANGSACMDGVKTRGLQVDGSPARLSFHPSSASQSDGRSPSENYSSWIVTVFVNSVSTVVLAVMALLK